MLCIIYEKHKEIEVYGILDPSFSEFSLLFNCLGYYKCILILFVYIFSFAFNHVWNVWFSVFILCSHTGCEYHGYVSDITRTWPVDGKFSDPQRILYEIVLALQLELIGLCNNLPTLDNLFNYMCRSLGYKLKEGGVFSSNVPKEKLAEVWIFYH